MWAQPKPCRLERIPFQYSLLVTSVLSAKLLHLYNHVTSLPPLLFLLYLPTFFLLDVLNTIIFWILVHLHAPGLLSILLALARTLSCLLLLAASSSQIAFYWNTGGELKWGAAKNFAHDTAGMKLLLSGGLHVLLVSILIVATSGLIRQPLYHQTRSLLFNIGMAARGHSLQSQVSAKGFTDGSPGDSVLSIDESIDRCLSGDIGRLETAPLLTNSNHSRWYRRWVIRVKVLVPVIAVSILIAVRPRDFPYAHMSGSLPFTLLEIWNPASLDVCQAGHSQDFLPFPLPHLISSEFWEPAHGKFVGWMPEANGSSINQSKHAKPMRHPYWLPEKYIDGFDRWYDELSPKDDDRNSTQYRPLEGDGEINQKSHERMNYDPIKDPLRITNLDQDVLAPILEALEKREVRIKHVVLLSLESTRKDVFPLVRNSHLHTLIMNSHSSSVSAEEANLELAKLTMNAEILTGEASGFEDWRGENSSLVRPGTWRNLRTNRGGINIAGALTGSTATLKSMLGSHCGAQPLPVDFTVEAQARIYQPCLPSILKLFNVNKVSSTKKRRHPSTNNSRSDEFASMPWKSVFVQPITDKFDHEDELNEHIGFSKVIVRENLLDPSSKHYPPTEKESNYFGFPESEVKPYLEDAFREAEERGERLFLSHLTSTTHHPWKTPESAFETIDYFKRDRWRPERLFNRYLNTIRYGDRWIGEVMDMLEDLGVAEKTLVVIVGDHGMAFKEDSSHYTTFENGHISNLRVPLLFYHPSLPRIQLSVNATSVSIIPTILDLLTATSSLTDEDMDIASNLIHQYEGQSLIRPYHVEKNGRQAWNIGVLNAGGAVLSVSSAATPFRLVLPVCKSAAYRFTSMAHDPNELRPLEEYSILDLAVRVRQEYSEDAAKWVFDAEKIGKWWISEQRRRWKYQGASLQDDRSPEEMKEAGKKKLEHWWET